LKLGEITDLPRNIVTEMDYTQGDYNQLESILEYMITDCMAVSLVGKVVDAHNSTCDGKVGIDGLYRNVIEKHLKANDPDMVKSASFIVEEVVKSVIQANAQDFSWDVDADGWDTAEELDVPESAPFKQLEDSIKNLLQNHLFSDDLEPAMKVEVSHILQKHFAIAPQDKQRVQDTKLKSLVLATWDIDVHTVTDSLDADDKIGLGHALCEITGSVQQVRLLISFIIEWAEEVGIGGLVGRLLSRVVTTFDFNCFVATLILFKEIDFEFDGVI
jgi:hypothetical protein